MILPIDGTTTTSTNPFATTSASVQPCHGRAVTVTAGTTAFGGGEHAVTIAIARNGGIQRITSDIHHLTPSRESQLTLN